MVDGERVRVCLCACMCVLVPFPFNMGPADFARIARRAHSSGCPHPLHVDVRQVCACMCVCARPIRDGDRRPRRPRRAPKQLRAAPIFPRALIRFHMSLFVRNPPRCSFFFPRRPRTAKNCAQCPPTQSSCASCVTHCGAPPRCLFFSPRMHRVAPAANLLARMPPTNAQPFSLLPLYSQPHQRPPFSVLRLYCPSPSIACVQRRQPLSTPYLSPVSCPRQPTCTHHHMTSVKAISRL